MIEFTSVTKIYKPNIVALKEVSLHISKGEFVFILGPSGAGKSTFTKLLLREEKPTKGKILVNGYNLNKIKERDVPYFRRTLGVVFQDFRLISRLTAYENVAFAMRVTNISEDDIKLRVPYILNLVGLSKKMHKKPSELSGGEQQRVALARALVHNPDLVIADEPTGNIDPELSIEIIELLQKINKTGTTIITVTHEHELAHKYSKRTIEMRNGQIIRDNEFAR